MFPSGVSKLRLAVFIVFCLVVWKTIHYFSLLEVCVLNILLFIKKKVKDKKFVYILNFFQTDTLPQDIAENPDNFRKALIVTVYYEALCSDSRNFILKQLVPTFEKLSDFIDVDLVPYGKATVSFFFYYKTINSICILLLFYRLWNEMVLMFSNVNIRILNVMRIKYMRVFWINHFRKIFMLSM